MENALSRRPNPRHAVDEGQIKVRPLPHHQMVFRLAARMRLSRLITGTPK